MNANQMPERAAERHGPDRIVSIVLGVLALALVPAVIVWIALRFSPAPEPTFRAFPEGSFPAQGFSLGDYRKEMEDRIHGLGWVDRDKKIAHVPIELGMQLMLARKPPARDTAPDGGRKQ
jgi:hypothetical protein